MSFKNNFVKLASAFHSLNNSKKISPTKSIMKKNNRGFSLVEIMMVVGMLGGLSLVVMNITKQSTKSSTKYQFDSEIMLITNEINGILSDPNKCLTTLTNATQAASPALPTTPSANIISPTGIAGIPSTVKKYTIAGGPYGNGGVHIASYSLNLAAAPDPLLTINFQKKGILGTGAIPKTIRLYVAQNAGIITTCRALSTSTTDIWSHGTGANANDIFYAGNVGIGTTVPGATLDVLSTTASTNAFNSNIRTGLKSTGTPTAGFGNLFQFLLDNSSNTQKLAADSGAVWIDPTAGAEKSAYVIRTGTAGTMSERLRIDYNGNVGIGTTNPTARLEVGGAIKPGAATIGASCSPNPEGSFAYDMTAHAPVYCSNTALWTAMGGGGSNWGGSYTTWEGVGGGCKGVNPYTGGCSCPAGFTVSAKQRNGIGWSYNPGDAVPYTFLCYK